MVFGDHLASKTLATIAFDSTAAAEPNLRGLTGLV
jgi:hypothetical protein